MENDPNKKESKGKRIIKKALRRNSKSSNSGQSATLDADIGVSRSKSFENKRLSLEINDSAPLPKPDGTADKADREPARGKPTLDGKLILNQDGLGLLNSKKVEINESQNETIEEIAYETKTKINEIFPTPKEPLPSIQDGNKRNLKRKLEEESGSGAGAGTSGASAGTSESDADDRDPSKDKKKKNRCAVCRKKVGLTGFECRCGGLFCAVHRYSDKHECSFDYRELGAQEIRRNNPVVVSQKIHKI